MRLIQIPFQNTKCILMSKYPKTIRKLISCAYVLAHPLFSSTSPLGNQAGVFVDSDDLFLGQWSGISLSLVSTVCTVALDTVSMCLYRQYFPTALHDDRNTGSRQERDEQIRESYVGGDNTHFP